MKKFLALLVSLIMVLALLVSCGGGGSDSAGGEEGADEVMKIGLVCIGDENDQGYTFNFIRGMEEAKANLEAEGIKTEWVVKYNILEDSGCEDANIELAEEGCKVIFDNSFGHEEFMLKVAPDYPDVQFVGCTNSASATDDLENTHNAFANIYEGRYCAGVVAGMKLQQMIDEGTIKEDEAVIGYVGAFPFAEVVSGYTAYYLGAKSACPSVTMNVQYVNSWSDATEEGNAAAALCDQGAKLISQHADNTTEATEAQKKGAFHTGYNNDMTDVAPDSSLISTRINWAPFFEYAIKAVAGGSNFDQDWTGGFADGAVVMTELNEAIAAPGTAEKLAETEDGIRNGSIKVFDTKTFTVEGKEVTTAFALDTDGDFTPDAEEAIIDGAFAESKFQSAPYFGLRIDGIKEINNN